MKIRYVIPALAAAAALAITGCSNADTSEAPEGEPVTGIQPDEAAVALLPEDIKAAGKLVLGSDGDYFPNEYIDDNEKLTGWGIELGEAISAKLGLEPQWEILEFGAILPRIQEDVVNVGASSFTDNLKRQEIVDFVNYYNAGILWAGPTGSDVDPENACGLSIAVQENTVEHLTELPARSDKCVAEGKPAIEILPFGGQAEATNAVVTGKADAFSADSPVTIGAVTEVGGAIEVIGEVFDAEPYGFAVKKDSGMAEAVQAALQSLMDDGNYMKILTAYGAESGAISSATINAGTSPGDE